MTFGLAVFNVVSFDFSHSSVGRPFTVDFSLLDLPNENIADDIAVEQMKWNEKNNVPFDRFGE